MMSVDGINRNNLPERVIKEIRKGKPWEPDILLVSGDSGRSVIVKDYYNRPFLYRFFIGLISIWNEHRMYMMLSGIKGIPDCYGKIDPNAIAIEYILGRNSSRVRPGEVTYEFFARLRSIVDEVHARGIVLCDLRNRKNVMVTNSFEPYVIDFVTAFRRGRWWNFPRNALFGIFYQDDLLGIIKLKKKLAPEIVSSIESDSLRKGLCMQKEVMAVRDFVVKHLKKLVRGGT